MELIHVFDALQVLAAMSDLHLLFQLDGTHLGEVYRSHEIFIIVQFFILFIKTGLYHFISNTLRFCSRIQASMLLINRIILPAAILLFKLKHISQIPLIARLGCFITPGCWPLFNYLWFWLIELVMKLWLLVETRCAIVEWWRPGVEHLFFFS